MRKKQIIKINKPNISILEKEGYSIKSVTINEVKMVFPISKGTQGDPSTQTVSEAFGYLMRNAVEAGDDDSKEIFQGLLNAYFHCCNNSIVPYPTHPKERFGLMGWLPELNGRYQNESDANSASDADEDIIRSLLDADSKGWNLSATDPNDDPANPPLYKSMTIQDLTLQAIRALANYDVGSFSFNGKSYDPAITPDC